MDPAETQAALEALERALAPAVLESVDLGEGQVLATFTAGTVSMPAFTAMAHSAGARRVHRAPQAGGYVVTLGPARTDQTRAKLAVRVPADLAAWVREERERKGVTAGELFWGAVEDHRDSLEQRLVGRRVATGLPPTMARRRRGGPATTQLWMAMTPQEITALDRLADAWCAGNRSALASHALAAARTGTR